jgi:hypothetical protein
MPDISSVLLIKLASQPLDKVMKHGASPIKYDQPIVSYYTLAPLKKPELQ